MNYNALLLLDKHHKLKKDYSSNVLNNNQFTLNKEKYNKFINIRTKNKNKYQIIEKCYSVKPMSYIMPKDIILKDIFQNSMKKYKTNEKYYLNSNNYNEGNINRKQIFSRIKKIILDKKINYDIYIKTIYLYDLLLLKRENAGMIIKNKFKKFIYAQNILIALTAFILIMKFNYSENKMIRVKKILQNFDDLDITLQDLYEMEIYALKLIDYDLSFHTPYSFMELFLINGIIFNEDYLQLDASFKIYELAKETIESIMETSNDYFKYNYFYLCCCIISYVRDTIHINKWPKALEINFGITFDEFCDVYNIFFRNNNNEKIENNTNCKNNSRNFYNSDIINIKNLKNINNIINVLKIMKSADKIKRIKEKINKIDLINNITNENKIESNLHQYMNDNIQTNSNSSNKIKVGLKKNWNVNTFKSPEKSSTLKTSIPYLISKLNEESINRISSLYIKGTEKKLSEDKYIKDIKPRKLSNSSSCSNISEKDEINELETVTNKFSLARSYNKYKRKLNVKDKNIQIINKSYINSCKSNLDSSYISYQKYNLVNNKSKKRENKDNIINKSNINEYNQSYLNMNNNNSRGKRSKYFNKFTEKKINKELPLLNSDLIKKQNTHLNTNSKNLNQTSFEEFHFYKHKPNIKQDNSEKDTLSKNKEENSDIPTCESSDPKLSFNDFSIRKTYRNKKLKNDTTTGRGVDKNKFYNKLKNTKISVADNSCGRKIGVRKFYKQKNLEENKYN